MSISAKTEVQWSTLGIIGSIITVVILSMWTVTGSLNSLIDKLEKTDQKINDRIILLESNKITQERLINWEIRFTSIEKDVTQLIDSFKDNCKEK